MYWPAEFSPQSSVQLTWPHARTDWGDRYFDVEPVFRTLARLIIQQADLIVAASDPERVESQLEASGADMNRARIFECPSDDVWARDHAPISVLDQDRPVLLDFRFDGWGGKFDA